jgi:TatD DNase family protein
MQSPAPLFDSHCHLDSQALAADRDGVLDRARSAGVVGIVTIGAGAGIGSARRAVALAGEQPGWIFATAGIHPHDARHVDDDVLEEISLMAARPEVVAIGETGLDFHYDNSPREDQVRAFREFVRLARQISKPVVVHTREAAGLTLEILREEKADEVGGIIHCFSEDASFAARAAGLGFVASFSGLVTFPRAASVLEAAVRQPLEDLLVETDAPFLAPVPHRGRVNEPAFVSHVVDSIAAARGMDPAELALVTTRNACRVYGLPEPAELG